MLALSTWQTLGSMFSIALVAVLMAWWRDRSAEGTVDFSTDRVFQFCVAVFVFGPYAVAGIGASLIGALIWTAVLGICIYLFLRWFITSVLECDRDKA